MKSLITLFILLGFVSCGLGARFQGVELSGTAGITSSGAPVGTIVGNVTVKNPGCLTTSYTLESDYNGYFKINDNGQITLGKADPVVGTYPIVVIGTCDERTQSISLSIVISPAPAGPSPISTIPFLKQLGAITPVPGGSTTGDELCGTFGQPFWGNGITVDSQGNTYCAGATSSSLGEGSGGGQDAFVAKFGTNGNLIWIRQLGNTTIVPGGSTAGNDACSSVAVDSLSNVYCAGFTDGSLGEASLGSADAFVMKLDSSGNLVWLKQLGAVTVVPGGDTTQDDFCSGVSVDNSGNVYCSGLTLGSLGEGFGGGMSDAFIAKFNSVGDIVWIKQLGDTTVVPAGSTAGDDGCTSVEVDDSGDIYCAGFTRGALGDAGTGSTDAFVMKLDSSGSIIWLRQLGGTAVVPGGNTANDDVCFSIAIDSLGNVFCAGITGGSLGEGISGPGDAFVMKLNPSGSVVWIRQLGDTTVVPGGDTSGIDMCTGVSVDSIGNIYCAGFTGGSLGEVGTGTGNAFIMKLDTSSNITWIKQLGTVSAVPSGSPGTVAICTGVAVDDIGNVYCGGLTGGALGEPYGGGAMAGDVFILKLNSTGQLL